MSTVKFTHALNRFFPEPQDTPTKGMTLKEILSEIEVCYPPAFVVMYSTTRESCASISTFS